MAKPRVYIETTIPSYLTAWPSRDLVRAAHQRITQDWWAIRDSYELFASRFVIEECSGGDPKAAADRLSLLADVSMLEVTEEATALAIELVDEIPLPAKAKSDAFHIAIAAVHGMTYLLTWNCKHIANLTLRPGIEAICRAAGFEPPLIGTPDDFGVGAPDDD